MCGIFGYYNLKPESFKTKERHFHLLLKESFSRGKEASGAMVLSLNEIAIIKSDLDGRTLLKTPEYLDLVASLSGKSIIASLGHSRLATNGSQLEPRNNQPVFSPNDQFAGVHNGIIVNADELWRKANRTDHLPELDTIALLTYYQFQLQSNPPIKALSELYKNLKGSASLAILDTSNQTLVLSSNTRSLYYIMDAQNNTVYFASERIFLSKMIEEIGGEYGSLNQITPNKALIVSNKSIQYLDLDSDVTFLEHSSSNHNQTIQKNDFSAQHSKSKAIDLYVADNELKRLQRHIIDVDQINKIVRCTKCILPVTTPFIQFDSQGICNYCNHHTPIQTAGIDALEKSIGQYKKSSGKLDCLAAFSGGRDSSYGLHFLKKELGLQPLAFTYDWGMVNDVARRNQARILSKLGIEQIIVSADITKKRKHIRQNILAWMKNPHLGMIPIFMQGDKQCEYYADQVMKNYNIDLMFFFRGNELEKQEFKTGHAGVVDDLKGGIIHDMQNSRKLKLLSFYAGQYIKNPAYFNASFFDAAFGFLSTYVKSHNYQYLWHYIPWDEQQINNTLINEYEWELPEETNQTWRTGDGSSAFYNYIYYQVQGFTENDSFRSRQIREGILDRETALQLIAHENKPRYKALKWYFDVVGLDGDQVLTVVDKMKKLY